MVTLWARIPDLVFSPVKWRALLPLMWTTLMSATIEPFGSNDPDSLLKNAKTLANGSIIPSSLRDRDASVTALNLFAVTRRGAEIGFAPLVALSAIPSSKAR